MAVFRLTADNLAFVKSELRISYPTIRSSHLTEALAAACGSQTNAALRARLAASAFGAEPLVSLDLGLWRERLTQLGYGQADFERLSALLSHSALPDPCWKVFAKTDLDGMNDWFVYCKRRNLPYVFIVMARKYAELGWDCYSVEPSHEGLVRGPKASPTRQWLFQTFQARAKADTGRPIFEGNTFVGTIERLLPATAHALADAYFSRLYDLTREPTQKAA